MHLVRVRLVPSDDGESKGNGKSLAMAIMGTLSYVVGSSRYNTCKELRLVRHDGDVIIRKVVAVI